MAKTKASGGQFNFRLENRRFDHLNKTACVSTGLRNENSTQCDPIWYRPRLFPKKRKFGNQNFFHIKIDQNMIFSRGQKNPCAPTCLPLWMICPINIRYLPNNIQNLGRTFLLYERNRNFKILDPLKADIAKYTLNGSTFSIFLTLLASKSLKNIRIYLFSA